ncbi:hypothetical protein O9G_005736 [Rozella allomycis CSF55]|uniref:Uncharacterized protein n=1 Tax=Rozella allomycis (strain CSF55) TaxID=988480 RepID=A0A075AT42_ROZAC|nr:hypothetical protein O9G_005736 [Rozella allomycis CSF55]|eukprot:EPZ31895.1 hypothetical protein O9G_005736 [Rozella allomycis CSF55]
MKNVANMDESEKNEILKFGVKLGSGSETNPITVGFTSYCLVDNFVQAYRVMNERKTGLSMSRRQISDLKRRLKDKLGFSNNLDILKQKLNLMKNLTDMDETGKNEILKFGVKLGTGSETNPFTVGSTSYCQVDNLVQAYRLMNGSIVLSVDETFKIDLMGYQLITPGGTMESLPVIDKHI